jgi:hypothetical protein
MVAHVASVRPLVIRDWQELDALSLSDAEKITIWNDLYEWNGDEE